jgi:guanine nucleotide-binding protein G(i) subunit alpha
VLVGAGESGKSTILKQMKMIHSNGYTEEEKKEYKEIIFSNAVQSMKVIVDAMTDMNVPLGNAENEDHVELLKESDTQIEDAIFPPDLATAIKALWQDSGIQAVFHRSAEYQLNDSAKYFFDSIERIADPNYIPNDQDVLRSRVKTTGIIESKFIIGDITYRMFDVGGQRSERKKWIHCFENVTAIIFMVAISEYDQNLVEDETVNRMQEALTLFDSICNSRWFVKTSIILFLNKIDIFKTKLPKVPISKFFPDYKGGADYDAATKYFIARFAALNHTESKQIYPHLTCATDTGQIKFVMEAVNKIIINNLLQSSNLI